MTYMCFSRFGFVIYRLKLWCFNMRLQDYFHQFKGHLTPTKPRSLTDSWHLINYETDILTQHISVMTIITGFHTSRRNHVSFNHQISQSFHGHHLRKMCLKGERGLWDWQLIMIKNTNNWFVVDHHHQKLWLRANMSELLPRTSHQNITSSDVLYEGAFFKVFFKAIDG